MPNKKQLWVLAGANGAGKSTFFKHYLADYGIKLVNADLIAKEMNAKKSEQLSYDAAKIAESIRNDLLSQGVSFCFETVF